MSVTGRFTRCGWRYYRRRPQLDHGSPYPSLSLPCLRFFLRFKVLFNLQTFHRENLGREAEFSSDLSRVAREASADGIHMLVQLLVGAAVSCSGKADYIQAIMQVQRLR